MFHLYRSKTFPNAEISFNSKQYTNAKSLTFFNADTSVTIRISYSKIKNFT